MSDITFMRGYGFPKGAGGDYAGYGGMLVNQRRRAMSRLSAIPMVPEPSIFSKIPALDGVFGTEVTFTADEADTITAGPVYGPVYDPTQLPPAQPSGGPNTLGLVAIGLGLWWLFGK